MSGVPDGCGPPPALNVFVSSHPAAASVAEVDGDSNCPRLIACSRGCRDVPGALAHQWFRLALTASVVCPMRNGEAPSELRSGLMRWTLQSLEVGRS